MEIVRVTAWQAYPWLRHGFSTRSGGVSTAYGAGTLNQGWTREDDPMLVAQNRRLFAEAVAAGAETVTLRQVHGTQIHVIDQPAAGPLEGDGLATQVPGVLLGIQTADCVPVMLVDVEHRVVAVLHAGWRGTAGGMAEKGVATMRSVFGSRPQALVAAVGPSIGPCCYSVGEEVREAFASRYGYAAGLFAGERLDLWQANRRQLLDAGIADAQITVVAQCTGCAAQPTGGRRFFSHRMEHGVTGRMMSVVGVTQGPQDDGGGCV